MVHEKVGSTCSKKSHRKIIDSNKKNYKDQKTTDFLKQLISKVQLNHEKTN